MLPLIAAAVVVSGLGDRPQTLLGTDGKDGYLAKLEQKLDDPGLRANYVGNALPNCQDYSFKSTDYRELNNQDVGSTDAFYTQQAQKPAVMEHVIVSGCGTSYRLNVIAMRTLADGQLRFFVRTPGDSITGLILQNDANMYASQGAAGARVMAGITAQCNQPAVVYDTKVTVTQKDPQSPWTEVWSTTLCGNKARIKLDFTPTPADGGTNIVAHVMKPEE